MRSTLSKILIALTLSGWLQLAAASEANCATSEVSPIKLRVTVSPRAATGLHQVPAIRQRAIRPWCQVCWWGGGLRRTEHGLP